MCDHLNTRANLSSILRLAGCFGVREVHAVGATRVDPAVSRGAEERLELHRPRSLAPLLRELAARGLRLVGLEQATGATPLQRFVWPWPVALVVGNERRGL